MSRDWKLWQFSLSYKRTGYSHFVLMKGPQEIKYDPLGDSVTVKEGYVESYRAFIAK